MKTKHYFQLQLIIIILFLFSCGNKNVETYYDNNKIKEKYQVDSKGNKSGTYLSYYENGEVKEESFFKNNKLVGERKLYFGSGKIQILENYNDAGELDGVYKSFYENGNVEIEKTFVKNINEGKLLVYYPNGNLKEEVTMVNNNENGPFTEYFENGKKQWEGNYLNGDNEFGLLTEWDSIGQTVKKMRCDSLGICRTIWKKGMAEGDTITLTPIFQ